MKRPSQLLLVMVAIGAGMTAFVSAQNGARRPLAIEDYYQVQTIGGMRWSPDGKTITFSVSTRVEEGNATRTETFTVPADGSSAPIKVEAPAGGGGTGRGGRAGGPGGTGGGAESPDGTVTRITRDLPRPAAPVMAMSEF